MTVPVHVDQQRFSVKTSHKIYIKNRRSDRCDRKGTFRLQFLCTVSFSISNVINETNKFVQIARAFFSNRSNRIQA